MKPILVTSYVEPDLDGVACAIGYAEFLSIFKKPAVAGISGKPHEEAEYLLKRFNIPYPISITSTEDYDEVVLADASDLNGLGKVIEPEKVIEIIDHRKVHEAEKFPNAKVQIELVGAAATLVTEKFMEKGISSSDVSAILLYGAIISNTFNFKAPITTDRDRKAADWLWQSNISYQPHADTLWRDMFEAKSDVSGTKLAKRLEEDLAWFAMGDKKVGVSQLEILGGRKVATERKAEILETLNMIKEKMNFDFVFLNLIDLEEGINFFVTHDTDVLLSKLFDVSFASGLAETDTFCMRKQIVPLLKAELEGNNLL